MRVEIQADPALVGGVYANALAIWHTGHEFTLDFIVNAQPPRPAQAPGGQNVIHAPQKMVARVRIPPGAVFEVIRALNENMTNYERVFGPIRRPGQDREPPLYPPPDLGNTGNDTPQ